MLGTMSLSMIGMIVLAPLIAHVLSPLLSAIPEWIVFNVAIVMSGAFPLLHIIGRLLRRPLRTLGRFVGINDFSTLGFVATLATNVTTFLSGQKPEVKIIDAIKALVDNAQCLNLTTNCFQLFGAWKGKESERYHSYYDIKKFYE